MFIPHGNTQEAQERIAVAITILHESINITVAEILLNAYAKNIAIKRAETQAKDQGIVQPRASAPIIVN